MIEAPETETEQAEYEAPIVITYQEGDRSTRRGVSAILFGRRLLWLVPM